jgi:hypothetical protein
MLLLVVSGKGSNPAVVAYSLGLLFLLTIIKFIHNRVLEAVGTSDLRSGRGGNKMNKAKTYLYDIIVAFIDVIFTAIEGISHHALVGLLAKAYRACSYKFGIKVWDYYKAF